MSKNETLYKKAKEAIQELFGDTSVGADETKRQLKALLDEIDMYLEALAQD